MKKNGRDPLHKCHHHDWDCSQLQEQNECCSSACELVSFLQHQCCYDDDIDCGYNNVCGGNPSNFDVCKILSDDNILLKNDYPLPEVNLDAVCSDASIQGNAFFLTECRRPCEPADCCHRKTCLQATTEFGDNFCSNYIACEDVWSIVT